MRDRLIADQQREAAKGLVVNDCHARSLHGGFQCVDGCQAGRTSSGLQPCDADKGDACSIREFLLCPAKCCAGSAQSDVCPLLSHRPRSSAFRILP